MIFHVRLTQTERIHNLFLTHCDLKLNLNKFFLRAAVVHLSKNKELIGDGE